MDQDIQKQWMRDTDQIIEWAMHRTHQGARFGHFQIPHADFTTASSKYHIGTRLELNKMTPLFVGSPLEQEALTKMQVTCNEKFASKAQTYEEFLDALEKSRKRPGKGSQCWKLPSASNAQGILPRKSIVVIFSLEPQMPAICALAFIAAVRWAVDIGTQHNSMVRILTMSPQELHPAAERLLGLFTGPLSTVRRFSTGTPSEPDPAQRCRILSMPNYNTWKDISSRVVGEGSGNLAIISFDPSKHEKIVDTYFKKQDRGVFLHDVVDEGARLEWIQPRITSPRVRTHLLSMSSGFRSPILPTGFDTVCLVLCSKTRRPIYDAVTGQVCDLTVPLSQEELREQLSWAGRFGHSNVRIYVEQQDLDQFISLAPNHRRSDVGNSQIGGFIAMVCDLESWGIDPQPTISCFIRDSLIVEDFTMRLRRQGILQETGFSIGLPEEQAFVFRRVLPLVGFDHRIALFLALPSSDPHVLAVKIQLSALLAVGLTEMTKPTAPNLPMGNLANECRGYTKPLLGTGCMWDQLGLWKRALAGCSYEALSHYTYAEAMNRKVFIDVRRTYRALDIMESILSILTEAGINMDMSLLNVTVDDEFTPAQCRAIQKDIFIAYVFQLHIMQQFPNAKTPALWKSRCVFNGREYRSKTNYALGRLRESAIVAQDPDTILVCGVCDKFTRDKTDSINDWTWIPRDIVDACYRQLAGGGAMCRLLPTVPRPPTNIEEL